MHAFLLPVYEHPHGLRRLIRALAHPEFVYVIHVDRKSRESPFRAALEGLENVYFTRRRFRVFRKGWSQIQATLQLIERAQEVGRGTTAILVT